MSFAKEFKEFAMRGNVMDMAVGVIIGGAFGKIVGSFVNDVLMPPLGMLMGGMDFGKLSFVLKETADPKDMVVLRYGMFINAVVDFIIIAFAIFVAVKMMNRLKKAEAPAPPTTKDCPKCCSAIPVKATKCPNCTSEVE